MDQVFIQQPFAFAGDVAPIPFPVDLAGNVSFNQGYGVDYQRDLSSDPLAKAIERDKQNYLFNVITQQLQQYQIFGTPEFITSVDNGGAPYSYAANARVRYRTTPGDPWNVYVSLVDSNTQLPTVTTHWRTVDQALTAPLFDNDTSIATTAFLQRNHITGIVARNTTTTLSAGSPTKLTYNVVQRDTLAMWDAANNVFVIPAGAGGVWEVTACCHTVQTGVDALYIHALVNGVTTGASRSGVGHAVASGELVSITASAKLILSPGDTVGMYVFCTVLGNIYAPVGSTDHNYFQLSYVGAV